MFLSYIHSFRAIAIVLIVAFHALDLFEWSNHYFIGRLLAVFLSNATVLFVFIAGYLFCYLSDKYRYGGYLKKKTINIIAPYLVVSVPAIYHAVFMPVDIASIYPQLDSTSKLYQIAWMYFHGGTHLNYALWFIPMITIFYIISPAFMAIIRRPILYVVLILLVPVSMLVHRPVFPNLNTLHSVLYFLSVYVVGMTACQYRDTIEGYLGRVKLYLAIILLLYIFLQALFADHSGIYSATKMFSFDHGYIDLQYFQKMILCFFLLAWLKDKSFNDNKTVGYIADISFTIFFIHLYFIFAIKYLNGWNKFEGNIAFFVAIVATVFICCMIVARIAQALLGKHGRYLIGVPYHKKN